MFHCYPSVSSSCVLSFADWMRMCAEGILCHPPPPAQRARPPLRRCPWDTLSFPITSIASRLTCSLSICSSEQGKDAKGKGGKEDKGKDAKGKGSKGGKGKKGGKGGGGGDPDEPPERPPPLQGKSELAEKIFTEVK